MKILIVEDHLPTIQGLANLISSQIHNAQFKIATNLADGLRIAKEWTADITLLDPGLPDSGKNMDDVFNSIILFPPPVIVVTGMPDTNHELLLRSYASGAHNFFEKRAISGNLISAIHSAYLRYNLFVKRNSEIANDAT